MIVTPRDSLISEALTIYVLRLIQNSYNLMQWSIALPVAREHEFLFCLFWLDLSYFAYIELASALLVWPNSNQSNWRSVVQKYYGEWSQQLHWLRYFKVKMFVLFRPSSWSGKTWCMQKVNIGIRFWKVSRSVWNFSTD